MRRATITIDDDLEAALEAWLERQEVPPALTSLMQAALREYLTRRGYAPPAHPLRITPARKGSGRVDVSLHHDKHLAEK